MATYTEKTAERIGRPLDAAATVRPRNGSVVLGVCAGIGAAIGITLLGGAIGGGIGGGLGAAIGIALASFLSRESDPPLAYQNVMALDAEGAAFHSVSSLSGRPTEEVFRLLHGEVEQVVVSEKMLTVRAEVILRDGRTMELEAGKFGVGTGREAFALLRERAGGADLESVRDQA